MALARAMGVLDAARREPGRARARRPARASSSWCTTPLHRRGAAGRRPTRRSGWAPRTTRSSPACTRHRRWSPGPRWPRPPRCGPGRRQHGVNVAGGLHHAMRRSASGFCVYNDPAIAIRWLLEQGAAADRLCGYRRAPRRRGPGRVLRRSAGADHQPARAPDDAVPRHRPARRHGRPGRRGHGGQRGAARRHRRRRLAARVRRGGAAAAARVPPGDPGQPARLRHPPARPARPPGADHRRPAGRAPGRCTSWRTRSAGGRWLLTGGGGYELVQVVPRTWTHLLAEAAGRPVDPAAWPPRRTGRSTPWPAPGVPAPGQMTDGSAAAFTPFESGYDPGDAIDRTIMATRSAVFPASRPVPGPVTQSRVPAPGLPFSTQDLRWGRR